jgi:hypothetical protein
MTTFRLALARHLHAEGFCVLPLLPGGKRPARKWKRFQTERPAVLELIDWFVRNSFEPGIVTGAISGITVIDCDSPEAAVACRNAGIVSSMTQRTRRGIHLVYAHDGERNTVGLNGMPGVDRRGEGGYVRAYPDSIHWTREAVAAAGLVPTMAADSPCTRGDELIAVGAFDDPADDATGEPMVWDETRQAWRHDYVDAGVMRSLWLDPAGGVA